MTSQTGYQIVLIHILPNVSRSKGKQTIKLGLLIEYIMRKIFFFKNHAQNVMKKIVPDSFINN